MIPSLSGAASALFAGLGEETVYRGHLFERLGKLFGARPVARAATVAHTVFR